MITGAVWSNTLERAQSYLINDIKQRYIDLGIEPCAILNSNSRFEICFENGDQWFARIARENSCGKRVNISYVDRKISREIVDIIIRPQTTRPPYNGISYF